MFTWIGVLVLIRAMSWENLFMTYANNKGGDQPAHLCSLISTFVVHCLDSIIPQVSISKISSLYLASVAAQASLCLTWRKPQRQVFSWRGSNYAFTAHLLMSVWTSPPVLDCENYWLSVARLLFLDVSKLLQETWKQWSVTYLSTIQGNTREALWNEP